MLHSYETTPASHVNAVLVGGVRTSTLSRQGLTQMVLRNEEASGPPRLLFDINGQGLAMALWNSDYRNVLHQADIIHSDGQPLVMASWLFTSSPIAERSATTDLFHDIARAAAGTNGSFYLLGGTEEVNRQCAEEMGRRYPGLTIAGRYHGYFAAEEEERLCEAINRSGAAIIWVGLGKPREQQFCARHRHRLTARWLITCGGCFNFVAGSYRRAPEWMQSAGVEWLHRMLTRPRQLALRYLTTSPVAAYLLLTRTRDIG